MKQTLLTLIITGAVTGAAVAGPLAIHQIPPSANWVLHFDADAVRGTQLGRQWLTTLNTPEANRGFDAFKLIFNFDPRQDLASITILGRDKDPERTVVIFRGRFDTQRLVTFVRANRAYETAAHHQHTIHSWIDEKKPDKRREYGCIYPDGSVLIGGQQMLREALDALDGRLRGGTGEWLTGLPADALLCAAADFVAAGNGPEAATLRRATSGQIAIREVAGTVFGALTLVGANAEVAGLLETAGKGLLAMILLDSDRQPELARLARNGGVTTRGTTVTLTLQGSPADVVEYLQREQERKKSAANK